MGSSSLQNKILAALLAISLIPAVWILVRRHNAEARNRTVELVIDYAEAETLAASSGKPIIQVLEEFKAAGATSVAVQEETIGDLLNSGDAVLIPKQTARGQEMTSSSLVETVIWVTSTQVETRLVEEMGKLGYVLKSEATVAGRRAVKTPPPLPPFGLYLFCMPENRYTPLTTDVSQARNIPVGMSPAALDAARAAGMPVVGRLLNYPGVTRGAIDVVMRDLREHGVSTVIFGQEQVLGFRGLIGDTAQALQENHLHYGSVEFAKQKGDAKLAKLVSNNLVRVHSIPPAELATLDRPTAIERYARAVKERNARMCYIRLFDTSASDAVRENASYISSVASNLKRAGFAFGTAGTISSPHIPRDMFLLLAVATAIGFMFLITSLWKSAWYYTVLYTLLACAIAALIVMGGGVLGRKVLALLTAIIFPIAATARAGAGAPEKPRITGYFRSGAKAVGGLLCVTAITAAGGAIVAAWLSEPEFMLKVDQFAGVKLAHLAPLFLILLIYVGATAWRIEDWKAQWKKFTNGLAKIVSEPVLTWQAVAVLAVLVLLAIAVARSGNDSGVGVSAFELKARAALDRLLIVRPRTKEFLIGHPILLIGIAAASLGRRRWAAPLIIFGSLGQISVMNTFCHIHTPIVATLIRVASGLVIGLVLGLILYAMMRPAIIAGAEKPKRRNYKRTTEAVSE